MLHFVISFQTQKSSNMAHYLDCFVTLFVIFLLQGDSTSREDAVTLGVGLCNAGFMHHGQSLYTYVDYFKCFSGLFIFYFIFLFSLIIIYQYVINLIFWWNKKTSLWWCMLPLLLFLSSGIKWNFQKVKILKRDFLNTDHISGQSENKTAAIGWCNVAV